MCRDDLMGKQGVRYVRRGKKKGVKVGFFFFEIIIALLRKNPEGVRASKISSQTGIIYSTVLSSLRQLEEMNRIQYTKLKVFNGPPVKHWHATEYVLK